MKHITSPGFKYANLISTGISNTLKISSDLWVWLHHDIWFGKSTSRPLLSDNTTCFASMVTVKVRHWGYSDSLFIYLFSQRITIFINVVHLSSD